MNSIYDPRNELTILTYSALQRTATCCNTLRNKLNIFNVHNILISVTIRRLLILKEIELKEIESHLLSYSTYSIITYSAMQHTATHCNTLQHTHIIYAGY